MELREEESNSTDRVRYVKHRVLKIEKRNEIKKIKTPSYQEKKLNKSANNTGKERESFERKIAKALRNVLKEKGI